MLDILLGQRCAVAKTALLFLVFVLGGSTAYAQCDGSDAKFIISGDYHTYGFFGQGSNVGSFGPVEESFTDSFEFPNGSTSRYVTTDLSLTGADGTLSVDIDHQAFVRARRDAGNDWGGVFEITVDIYVKGPPGTPYFVDRDLLGSVSVNRVAGAGTSHANMLGTTAVVNGSGSQTLPVSSAGTDKGVTTNTPHPSCPDYHYATSVSIRGFGFIFQSIDICIFGNCGPFNYPSNGLLSGTITAGCTGGCEPDEEDQTPPPTCLDEQPPAAPEGPQCPGPFGSDDFDLRTVSDPIYLFSGEMYLNEEDLRIKGRGTDFVWSRKYRSKFGVNSAQGNGWDCSYNIFLNLDGDDLVLSNGWNRTEVFPASGSGVWTRDEFFYEIVQQPDNSYRLTFPDSGTWDFAPIDGSAAQGKLTAINNRNGNFMGFAYDPSGRLSTITDTLGRNITIAYNADNFIASVTDFDGRVVQYDYYDGIEPGGSFGDLKSVTTPTVTGTPNGNDFPAGKTTTYTYSSGFADDRLNHNLLTITDPRGNTIAVNEYASTTDPDDLLFDRVVRQTWGDVGDLIDLTYVTQTPSPENANAIIKTIVNDREGHVKEFFFDSANRLLRRLDYTGLADSDLPTTEVNNRPGPPLRGSDPAFFETTWEYNADSLPTRIIHPNLKEEEFIYDDANADPRAHGNLLEHRRLPGPLGGDQILITETFEYDEGHGGCCGTNFVTRHVDGRGNETLHTYDDFGNRTHTMHRIPSIVEDFEYNEFGQLTAHTLPDNGSSHRRRDEYAYYDAGPQRGYMAQRIVDATGFALTTTYEYDNRGNVIRETDPRGAATDYFVNALDQIVRETRRHVQTPSGAVRYFADTFYDANDNVVRLDVQNVRDDGTVDPINPLFTTTFEYETLNRLTRKSTEVDPVHNIDTEYAYDANRNRVLTRYGEATNESDPFNVVQVQYDERDLVFREINAPGHPTDQSSTQYDYDLNGNLVVISVGLEETPRIEIRDYDGYDRLLSVVDPMGNVTLFEYDANGNRVLLWVDGEETDVPDSTMNVRLREVSYVYDQQDRQTRREEAFFDTASQIDIDDGLAVTETFYNANSQIVRVVDDNGHEQITAYDTANRRSVLTDGKGNTRSFAYDENSNVVSVVEVEKSDLGASDEIFSTSIEYDGLDRQVAQIDNIGNRTDYAYDSRDNRTLSIDQDRNIVQYQYDGLNRLTFTTRVLTDDGTGSGNLTGTIVTSQTWDDSSRLTSQVDDNGNATEYAYDALNRKTTIEHADGTRDQTTYDIHGNAVTMVDPNNSVQTCTYDLLNRLTGKQIVAGPGVSSDTTAEGFMYDGLSRIVSAVDDDSTVSRSYDSLSNVTAEILNGELATFGFDGVGNQLLGTYPGGRSIFTSYDELDRKKEIRDGVAGPLIAQYDYVGVHRVERRSYANGSQTEFTYDGITGIPNEPGDFGVRRIVRTRHTRGGDVIDDRTYSWDRRGSKTRRTDVRTSGPQLSHQYSYDSVNRLVDTEVTDGGGSPVRATGYELDGVHNRRTVIGDPDEGRYTLDGTIPDPADVQVNQYTTTPVGGGESRSYDANGNLTSVRCIADFAEPGGHFDFFDVQAFLGLFSAQDPAADLAAPTGAWDFFDVLVFLNAFSAGCDGGYRQIVYDYNNRMVSFEDEDGMVSTYSYDALGRRISRIVDSTGSADETRYFYDNWQVVEEQSNAGATEATYVYGVSIDEVLHMQRGSADFFYHGDDLGSVFAVSDASGAAVERYEYDDYGDRRVLDAAGSLIPDSVIGNPYAFVGRRFDQESSWYHYRTRQFDPRAGRFTSRDTLGTWHDQIGVGNGRIYAGSSPWTLTDPFGRESEPGFFCSWFEWLDFFGWCSTPEPKPPFPCFDSVMNGVQVEQNGGYYHPGSWDPSNPQNPSTGLPPCNDEEKKPPKKDKPDRELCGSDPIGSCGTLWEGSVNSLLDAFEGRR